MVCAQSFYTQIPGQQSAPDQSDVLRVFTELVQTDVMVFDAQGRFVNDLKPEDFELRIDGSPKPIAFFEKVTAGTANEESQLAAARGAVQSLKSSGVAEPLDRGRPVFFYVDDLHMDLKALDLTRKLVTRFIESEMGQNDEAAIVSASGQIGFLQQLTDNKAVLRAALERLKGRSYSVRDSDTPSMTEYQALLIDSFDRQVADYFIDEMIRRNPGLSRQIADGMVKGRARGMLQQASFITNNTLAGLEGLVRSANNLSGRKLMFFISGGFFLDDNSNARNRLRQITSAAARNGIVIYSIDARGLTEATDASSPPQFDPTHRLVGTGGGREVLASQDGLNALALDTGGRPLLNSNSTAPALAAALKETSTYYLLAWKPSQENQHAGKFRTIEVKVVGKPQLKVQVRRGFFDREPETVVDKGKKPKERIEDTPAEALKKAVVATRPPIDIPVSLDLSYAKAQKKGLMLAIALQVPKEFVSFATVNDKQVAVLAVAGTVFSDRGVGGASFSERVSLEATSSAESPKGQDPIYGQTISLGPGIYQVRVAVRDEKTGRVGGAHGWIEIPNIPAGLLALSSLQLARRKASSIDTPHGSEKAPSQVSLSIAHNFSTDEYLQFLLVVYNAALAPADSKPDIALQLQVLRDGQPVITIPLKKVAVDKATDPVAVPYAAEMPLQGLPTGRYLLRVTVVDRVAQRSASQQTHFAIQ
jgi:VWFA-related protein